MSSTDTEPFRLAFERVEREPKAARFKVTFNASRGPQDFDIAVFIDDEDALWENVVRLAMHRLHHDFAQLARQTAQNHLEPKAIADLA